MKLVIPLLAALLASCASGPSSSPETAALTPVAALDLPRYLGRWYEIANYPNRFQRQCVGETSAEYRLEASGKVRVQNRCRKADGSFAEARGVARRMGGEGSPRLEVRFAPAWLGWLPAVWGRYWVIDIDPDYQLAAVSEPNREYLWILARTPQVPEAAYQALLARLRQKGFSPERLQRTPQPGSAAG